MAAVEGAAATTEAAPAAPDPWPEALVEAIAQFGGQAKEAQIGSWLRLRQPELADAASDLNARIGETLRGSRQFMLAGKGHVWRLGRSITVARTPWSE